MCSCCSLWFSTCLTLAFHKQGPFLFFYNCVLTNEVRSLHPMFLIKTNRGSYNFCAIFTKCELMTIPCELICCFLALVVSFALSFYSFLCCTTAFLCCFRTKPYSRPLSVSKRKITVSCCVNGLLFARKFTNRWLFQVPRAFKRKFIRKWDPTNIFRSTEVPAKQTSPRSRDLQLFSSSVSKVAIDFETLIDRHRGNTFFCRAITSSLSQRLLHRMTNSRAVLKTALEIVILCSNHWLKIKTQNGSFSQPFKEKCISEVVRIGNIIIFHLSKLYCQVLHTMWCDISGEAAGEIWNWSLMGMNSVQTCPVLCRFFLLWTGDRVHQHVTHLKASCSETANAVRGKCAGQGVYSLIWLATT